MTTDISHLSHMHMFDMRRWNEWKETKYSEVWTLKPLLIFNLNVIQLSANRPGHEYFKIQKKNSYGIIPSNDL